MKDSHEIESKMLSHMEAMWKSYSSHVMGKPYSVSWKPSESHGKPSDVNVVKSHMKVELGEFHGELL
jgi:hypothetical protein